MLEHEHGARPTDRAGLRSWYQAALARQASSLLRVTEYAARLGVNETTLYHWRCRLLRRGSVASLPTLRSRLVEVAVTGPSNRSGDAHILRVAGGRHSIEVPGNFDGDALRRLLAVLESC